MVACALVVLGAFAPAASARRVERKSATGVLPDVDLLGRLRDRERIVSLSTSTAANAQIEVYLQAFCFDAAQGLPQTTHTHRHGPTPGPPTQAARLRGLLRERIG